MTLQIRPIANKSDLKTFIYLPEKIHASHKTWVHPIYREEHRYFNPKKNPAFDHCDTILLLAFDDVKPVGRVMGIINHRYNERKGVRTARFAYLETYKHRDVVHALLSYVEDWARANGMTQIIGPYGFSDQDPEGFLIEGFEHRATIVTYHNFDWMPGFIEACGYSKEIDYVVHRVEISDNVPRMFHKIKTRIIQRGKLEVLEAHRKKDIKPWIKEAFLLLNESFEESNIFGFDPMSQEEMDALVKQYFSIIDHRFLKGVRKGDKLVGFVIGIPDMTRGIQKARGRLFPFGWLKILMARRKTRQIDALLGAVKKEYRGLGADILMLLAMYASLLAAGFETIDSHHQMESNKKIQALYERIGGKVYKRFRVYRKAL